MNDFTSANREKVIAAGVILALVIALIVLFQQLGGDTSAQEAGGSDPTATDSPVPGTDPLAATEPIEDAYALLPHTEEELGGAAEIAREFAIAYSVVDPDETHDDRLDRLRDLTAPNLASQLDVLILPPPLAGSDHGSNAASAVAEVATISNVGDRSVTCLVETHITTETTDGVTSGSITYAVTLTAGDGDWAVLAFEDATMGNGG